jgi:hypothetical protein
MRNLALAVLLLYATTVAAFNWRGRPANTPEFERGANAALDATLWVGNDSVRKHEHLDWLEIERRVAKRLKIKRDEWWLGGER